MVKINCLLEVALALRKLNPIHKKGPESFFVFLSPWFSAACPVAIVHSNYLFQLYQQDKSSDSKVKFRQASNCCKRVLEAVKLAYANETKESITSQKFGPCDFWQIANNVLSKGKSAIPLLFNCPKVFSSVSDTGKMFAKNFSGSSNL